MEHVSPQSLVTRSSPESTFAMDSFGCPSTGSLSVTKPVKKRKSWGQELPEPKTSLPPRKRAKTEDEKEQRRIERIKRNRAAAHNSRERKRLEAEQLATANDGLHRQLQLLRQRVAVQEAQLAKCKEQLGSLPDVSVDEIARAQRQSSEPSSSAPSPCSSSTIDPRASLACSTPATMPDDTPYIKLEDNLTESSLFDSLDPTQHSAAMLCDLQCRSSGSATSPPSLRSTLQAWCWTRIILSLMQASLMSLYRSSLTALWTSSLAQPSNPLIISILGSTSTAPPRTSTTRSPTQPPNWSTLAQLFLLATGPSMSGSSAPALSGLRDSGKSSFADRGSGRSLDRGRLWFDHKSIGFQERERERGNWDMINEHNGKMLDASSKAVAAMTG